MGELWFYHLERETSEQLLPLLLRRGLERGLRLSVETTSAELAAQWSQRLWAAEDVAFLPHGLSGDANASAQPIWIACGPDNENAASFRFYVDGAQPALPCSYERASLLFNGRDEAEVAAARDLWKRAKAAGIAARYQKQDESGQWREAASS
jgi:DNA polymerase-3 subunit chi